MFILDFCLDAYHVGGLVWVACNSGEVRCGLTRARVIAWCGLT